MSTAFIQPGTRVVTVGERYPGTVVAVRVAVFHDHVIRWSEDDLSYVRNYTVEAAVIWDHQTDANPMTDSNIEWTPVDDLVVPSTYV